MPTAYDPLTGADVDTASEEWRHHCECQWLLTAKPTKSAKHLYLYGVTDRNKLLVTDQRTGATTLNLTVSKDVKPPLMKYRGIEAADRILADARKLHELTATT